MERGGQCDRPSAAVGSAKATVSGPVEYVDLTREIALGAPLSPIPPASWSPPEEAVERPLTLEDSEDADLLGIAAVE